MTMSIWLAVWIGVVPLVGWLLWWLNDMWHGLKASFCSSKGGVKLPPGHMGLPFIGEMLNFLWYFKVLGRPDDYINYKRRKYGDGIGMYRTHLFGRPSIIAFSSTANKFVFKSEESFMLEWPHVDLLGRSSLFVVHGKPHARLRSFVLRSINQPQSLRHIALTVQPRLIKALHSWAERGTINASKELKKVTFENIGKLFASFEPGPDLTKLDKYFAGLIYGFRAYPLNIPGTACHHAHQCRKKAAAIFREELEKRKRNQQGTRPINDLMDSLMNMKNEDGNQLTDSEVLDNIVSLVIGGYLSTALALMWAVYYLAKYPMVLQKLQEENMTLKRSKKEELVTSDEIFSMKYTTKVVDEIIRMANISSVLFRTTTKDVEYKGYTIPKGWKVLLWSRYLHTDPENFKDPMCFNPDRWEAPMAAETYLQVFGGGSRLCTGNMLACLQLAIFIHHLTTGYKWELVNPDAIVTYLPLPQPVDGVEINIKKL